MDLWDRANKNGVPDLELVDYGQIDKQIDRYVYRQKDTQGNIQIESLIYKQIIKWTFGTEQIKMEYQIQSLQILGRQKDKLVDRQKDTQVNRQKDTQVDRQIDTYVNRQID